MPRQRLQHRLLVAVAEGYVRLRSDRNPACTTASVPDAASFHSTAATRGFKALIAASFLVSDYNSAFRSSCRRLRPVAQRPYSGAHDGFGSGRSLVSLDSCYEGFQSPYPSLVPRQRLQLPLFVAVAEGYVQLRSYRNPACTTASFADAASFHSTAATRGFKGFWRRSSQEISAPTA